MANNETLGHKEGMEHLALVRALSQEVSSAISAIERNDLAELTTRVAAQDAICFKLNQKGPQTLQLACEPYRASCESSEERSLWQAICEAHTALSRLNRTYAGLVKRSQRSIELIAGLYRNPDQSYDRNPTAQPGKHTWSCEA
jgi:hypothetical protein